MSRLCVVLGLVAFLAGCGGSAEQKPLLTTVPVNGVVTFDGKPLPKAAVKFVPHGETKGVECFGVTDDAGRYELMQLRGATGAPPGNYRVVISQFAKADGTPVLPGAEDLGAKEALPPRFSSASDSRLMAQVQAPGGEIRFDLKGR